MLSWFGLRLRLVVVVLLALLPVFGLFAYSVAKNQEAAVLDAQTSLQAEALLAAVHQQRLVERAAQLLSDIASSPSIKDRRISLCAEYLGNLQVQNPIYADLGVVGLDGKISCRAVDTDKDNDQASDLAYFRQVVMTQKFSVGEYAVGRVSGRPGLAFSMPVYSSEDVFNGVAFAALELDIVQKALQAATMLDGAYLRVIDRRGVVLAASPASAGRPGTQESDSVVMQAANQRQAGGREALDSGGARRLYAYAPVGGEANGELFVAISVPRDVITAVERDSLQRDLAGLLALTAFGTACAWAMGKRLVVNPVNAILKAANEIARGNLQARVNLNPLQQDEIGQLGRSFNRMAESLQLQRTELNAALRHANEERVLLDLILNSMSDSVVSVNTVGQFLLFNASAGKLYGAMPPKSVALDDWRSGHSLVMLNDKKTVCPVSERPLMQALRGNSVDNCELMLRRLGEEDRVLRISARPLYDADRQLVGGVAMINDITEVKAAEDFAQAQEQVLTLIAEGASLQQSLRAIVLLIEKSLPGSLCSVLQVEAGQLRHGVALSLPEKFMAAIEGMQVAESMGVCGTAVFRKEAVFFEDVTRDPMAQEYRDLLLDNGLRACWSTPVISGDGNVLATFTIYSRTPYKPQARDRELIATAARLARIALQRARIETALINSEARFRELAENVEDVFYNFDIRTKKMLYVSPGYEKIWGRSCDSLYANPSSYVDQILLEDRELLRSSREQVRLGKAADVKFRILCDDGQTRWIHNFSYPVFDAAGEIVRVVGTGRDITERQRASQALANTNRALQMLSRSSIAINRINDEAALLAEVCRVAVEVGGYRMAWVGYAQDDEEKSIQPMAYAGAELGYLSSIKLYWSDDQAGGQGPAGKAIRTGQPQQSRDVSQRENQFHWHEAAVQRGYLSAVILPLRSEQRSFGVLALYAGEIQEFAPEEVKLLQELADNLAFGIGSLRTWLERQRSEAMVHLAAVKLREQASLLDLAQDAIIVRNLDKTLRFWNQGAERLYGWTAAEVLGKTMQDFMYRDLAKISTAMEQTLASGGDWSGELKQIARDGSTVYVESRCTVVRDENGQINGVMSVNTDIRERKQAREEILKLNASLEERVRRRTAQLEIANQQLESFSYSVSHDLRGPLRAIDGFSHLLEKSMTHSGASSLTERSGHYLVRIRAGVAQMGELIDAMLSLAQVSRSSLLWEPVDLGAQAEVLLAGFQEREPARATRLQVQAGLLAQGDPRLLKQVLDNLLGNAWKFTAGQACTCITVGRQQGDGGQTVYFVRDNGAGFDMAYAEKLFIAFQRLHSQAEFSGTGIGLATVHRIIERHSGKVWAESSPGQGATFYFTLGAAPA